MQGTQLALLIKKVWEEFAIVLPTYISTIFSIEKNHVSLFMYKR